MKKGAALRRGKASRGERPRADPARSENRLQKRTVRGRIWEKGGEGVDVHNRLRELMKARGWSAYRLAQECGLSESTLANLLKRNTMPTVSTLEAVCSGFGISLAQFFAEGELVELTPELREVFDGWAALTPEQKQAVLQTVRAMRRA